MMGALDFSCLESGLDRRSAAFQCAADPTLRASPGGMASFPLPEVDDVSDYHFTISTLRSSPCAPTSTARNKFETCEAIGNC